MFPTPFLNFYFLIQKSNDSDGEQRRPQSSAAGLLTPVHGVRGMSSSVSKSPSFGSIANRTTTPSLPSAMRPTISSANKTMSNSGGDSGKRGTSSGPMKGPQRRISSAVSTGDIQEALHDSSSSEDIGASEGISNVKARVLSFEKSVGRSPARPSSTLFTPSPSKNNPARRSLFINPGASSPVTVDTTVGGSSVARSAPSTPSTSGSSDVNKMLSRASCEEAIEAMKASADQLLLLQRRLAGGVGSSSESGSESNLSDRERAELLQLLSAAATPVIQSLRSLQFPPAGLGIELERPALTASPQPNAESNPLMVQMMHQYSEMLLSMVQQRIGVPAPPSPR